MKINRLLFTAAIAVPFFFTACKKTNNAASGFNYKLTATNRSSVVARIETGNVVWTSGYASATQVKFEAKKTDNTAVEYKSSVSQRIDLFTALAATLGNVTLPAGAYKEVEFKGELAPSGTNAALELNGTFTSGLVTTPVVFTAGSPVEIKTEVNNVTIADNAGYTALTSLNLSLLTQGITEAMMNSAQKTNGSIIISSASNVNLYNIILSNLDNCDGVEFEHD